MHRPPLIHVGYHKTATTWLQQSVFADERSGFHWVLGKNWEARRYLVAPTSLCFDSQLARQPFEPGFDESARLRRVPVISDERLSGNPHSGGYDSKENAERLAQTFPDARVMIVVRRQQDAIYSTYDQYVQAGGACSIVDYLTRRTRLAMPMFRLEHFQYHRLIRLYQSLFGADHVLVLAYEQLKADAAAFLGEVMRFSGGDSTFTPNTERRLNPGRPAVLNSVLRRLNPFLVRDDLNAFSIFAVPRLRRYVYPVLESSMRVVPQSLNRRIEWRIRDAIAATCSDVFRESNRITARLTGIDLGGFGYDLDDVVQPPEGQM